VVAVAVLATASTNGSGQAQGIGFAIPSNLSRDIARLITDSGHVTNSRPAALGVQADTVTSPTAPPRGGIVTVIRGGPADRPG
jgi:S1-C subfamily serine protease